MRFRTLLIATLASLLTAVLASQAQVPGVNSTLQTVFTLAYDNSTMKPSYSARAAFTPGGTPTDVCSITGSSTRRVKVRRIVIAGTLTTTITEYVAIVKRSTANSAGAGSAMTKVPYDSNNAASTVAVAEVWTGTAPTVGTLVGVLADIPVTFAATTIVNQGTEFKFGELAQPVVLRGVAQQLSLNLEGQGGGAGTIQCFFEWTEDND